MGSSAETPSLGRFDGILEYAREVAGQGMSAEALATRYLVMAKKVAGLYLLIEPTEQDMEVGQQYLDTRKHEYARQLRSIQLDRFTPVEETEFDTDFGSAGRVLLPYYRTSFFDYLKAEGVRNCTAMRLLEVGDENYALINDLRFAHNLSRMSGADYARETLEMIASTELNEE